MKEEIGQILEQLKLNNLSVAKVEKALEFSNGTLGKARDGKINLPTEKLEKLRAYAKVYLEKPALDGKIIPLNLEWVGKIESWCKEKGFPPTELIEKFEGLENQLKKMIAHNNLPENKARILSERDGGGENGNPLRQYPLIESQNKPDPALEIKNEAESTPKDKKGQQEAEKGHKPTSWHERLEKDMEPKPKELSPFLKARQNLKNGMK